MSSLADESFVILGSSPTHSVDEVSEDVVDNLSFSSLKKEVEQQRAQAKRSLNNNRQSSKTVNEVVEVQAKMTPLNRSNGLVSAKDLMIWSRPSTTTSQVITDSDKSSKSIESSTQTNEEDGEASMEQKKTSLNIKSLENNQKKSIDLEKKEIASSLKSVHSLTATEQGAKGKDENLAASFIMGEISADELKTKVYSQYPSIAMDVCLHDMLKLQNIAAEHENMKMTLAKLNDTISSYHLNNVQRKENMEAHDNYLKEKLAKAEADIESLIKINNELKEDQNLKREQLHALELVHKNELNELTKDISEKTSLIENMRKQMERLKLESKDNKKPILNKKTANTVDESLDNSDEKKYINENFMDEIHYLQTRLISSQIYVEKLESLLAIKEISEKSLEEQLDVWAKHNEKLRIQNEENFQTISLLKHNNIEYLSKLEQVENLLEDAKKEKQVFLKDLQNLQQQNRQLNDRKEYLEQQNQTNQLIPEATTPPTGRYCPVCFKTFPSAYNLQLHVNVCLDEAI